MSTTAIDYPWVHFKLYDSLYGISSEEVQSMVYLTKTVTVPGTPDYIRGMMNVREGVVKCIDLRRMLGLPSIVDEIHDFESMMDKRKQDHVNWLSELETSVKEHRDFTLTTDPHACAFGKWYDSFTTDNVVLKSLLTRFEAPHKKIHRIAITVREFESKEKFTEATAVIEKTRNRQLSEMIKLFDSVKKAYAHGRQETVIILDHKGTSVGIIVDEVVSVEAIVPDDIDTYMLSTGIPNLQIAKHKHNDALTMLLDTAMF